MSRVVRAACRAGPEGPAEADAIENAVNSVLEAGHRTGDIAKPGEKKVTCSDMGTLIAAAI